MTIHSGSCHCGAVKFEIEADITDLSMCDCSLCTKKNALMTKVHETQFRLISGDAQLSEYKWNTQVARHFFCSVCGIYTFHRKRALPDHYEINVQCLDDFDHTNLPIRRAEGLSMTVVAAGARKEWRGPRGS